MSKQLSNYGTGWKTIATFIFLLKCGCAKEKLEQLTLSYKTTARSRPAMPCKKRAKGQKRQPM